MSMNFNLSYAVKATWAALDASGCETVADFLTSPLHSQAIKTIILWDYNYSGGCFGYEGLSLDVTEWGVDGLMLGPRPTVRLRDEARQRGSFLRFLHALASIPSLTSLSIEDLELTSPDEFSAFSNAIISLTPSLSHLQIHFLRLSYLLSSRSFLTSWNVQIGEALLNSTSLQSLSLDEHLCSEVHFMPLLTCSCSLKSLSLELQHVNLSSLLQKIITGLHENTISLSNMRLAHCVSAPFSIENLGQMLGTMLLNNTSLTSLQLYRLFFAKEAVHCLFTSLKKNLHLTSLSLAYCGGEDWSSASILDSLQAHAVLHKVDLSGTCLQGDAAIAAQLSRNKENSERLKVMKSQGSIQVRPTTVRLFLCGLPYSGKTTLAKSLAKKNKGSLNNSLSRFKDTKRSRGIEVTILEEEIEEKRQRISLWDMAGQTEYHSFHDIMFPNLSSRATPSMFLYVWNPFEVDANGKSKRDAQGRRTRKSLDKFRDEFRYWLKFIASKTLRSETFKPKLLFVVTRADFGFEHMKIWLEAPFTALKKEFQEFIHFDMEGFFEVDARDPMKAVSLASYVFDSARIILETVPDVFQACDDARKVFSSLVLANQVPPLVTKERFYRLCYQHLGMDSPEMREVVALSLNDSGDLIYFKSLELVVMDIQWFCQRIMGDLLYESMINEPFDGATTQGFFPVKFLEKLLERKVNLRAIRKQYKIINRGASESLESSKSFESMKVEGDALVKLLVGMRLACPKDSCQKYSEIFIPASLSRRVRGKILPSKYLRSDGNYETTYLGRRLSCKDSRCTFLTPGIFPLLQVTFHNILSNRRVLVEFELDVIAFACDGIKVFVEFCRLEGEDYFIDILVSSRHTVDDTIEWLHENVIVNMEKVCAEPKGIQGVELVHAVIRPSCVARFLEARDRQAVPVQELQDVLKNHVQRKGVKINDDGISKVFYTWQSGTLQDDYVVDLLGENDTAKVLETYWCGLTEAVREMSNIFIQQTSTSEQQRPEFRTSPSGKENEAIFDKLCELTREVREGHRDLQKLGVAIQDLRSTMFPKLHELFTFVMEGELGKLPRMFVVTVDDGFVRKVVSAMVPSLQNVRLELLCECHSGPHLVDRQQGLRFATLDDGLLKRGLPFINAFLKVAHVVVKVGAHVAVGCGDSIPDFTRVLANIVDTFECGQCPTITNVIDKWSSSSRIDFQEGQQWLFDVLSNRNCIKGEKIHEVFGLQRVRYDNGKVAWVCDKHYKEAKPWPV